MPPNNFTLPRPYLLPGGPDIPPGRLLTVEKYRRQNRPMRLVDDIFMRACFQGDSLCAELVLRIILHRELKVLRVTVQSQLTNLAGRSIIMDILAEDEDGNQYDIEVQIDLRGANPKRPRYILSAIDMAVQDPGKYLERLPETFSIFIVMGDPFGAGEPIYVFTRRTESGLPLGDGTTIIYVNVLMHDFVTLLGRLMHDFCCSDPDRMFFPELEAVTRHFKEDVEGVCVVGNMSEDIFESGRKAGRQEGRDENQRSTVARLLAQGKLTLEEIAAGVDMTLPEVRALSEQLRGA